MNVAENTLLEVVIADEVAAHNDLRPVAAVEQVEQLIAPNTPVENASHPGIDDADSGAERRQQ